MSAEPLTQLARQGLRGWRFLQLRSLAVALGVGVLLGLHDALWSRLLAAVIVLAFLVVTVLIPWVRGGFTRPDALIELLESGAEGLVWVAVHQVPNRAPHLSLHDDQRRAWRLRLESSQALELIDALRDAVPRLQVTMASVEREIEWSESPEAPRSWPKAPPLQLTAAGFRADGS